MLDTGREALLKSDSRFSDLVGLGIANQRETALVWNRRTGKPIHNAIVWQDRRTAPLCAKLKEQGLESMVSERTGLLLDPYFSATKIAWLLDNVENARALAEKGELAFGTVDSFLIWRLTGGRTHVTDATNASRTLLLNIHSGEWDDGASKAVSGAPRHVAGSSRLRSGFWGDRGRALRHGAPDPGRCRGSAGGLDRPGMLSSRHGQGDLRHRLFRPVEHRRQGSRLEQQAAHDDRLSMEGEANLRGRGLDFFGRRNGTMAPRRIGHRLPAPARRATLATHADPEQRVYIVPAFTGLGAPHWDSEARAAIIGLTRGATRKEIARAALECVAYQTRDLVAAMHSDSGTLERENAQSVIRVDGGMSASNWTMQFLADMLDAPVDRPAIIETTALGAAFLAGWQAGLYPGPDEFGSAWRSERRFAPKMPAAERESRYLGWRDAVARVVAPSGAR